jgi:hypothetical protein
VIVALSIGLDLWWRRARGRAPATEVA